MTESSVSPISLTVDIRRNRLRIFKSVLHQLGDPKYIQLLVNPEDMIVALRCVDYAASAEQTHKVTMVANSCVEITSLTFLRKLCSVVGGLDPHYSYRLSGTILTAERVAVFSLKTIKRIEKQEN